MKAVHAFLYLLFTTSIISAQKPERANTGTVGPADTIRPGKGSRNTQLREIKEKKVEQLSDSVGQQPPIHPGVDTLVQNKYGNLLRDDPDYNKRYPLWIPAVEVIGLNGFIWSMDRYVLKYDFAKTSTTTWKNNIKYGWEWDQDRFGTNFIAHPYSGSLYFNAGRSNGYNYLQSGLFAVGGSLMWEYFGENTRPSYNDLINTPINGIFLGEVLYRISSNILDDRRRGFPRVTREVFAGLIDPVRGVNRVLQGKAFRVTNKEVYQEEPLNISLLAGMHHINKSRRLERSGSVSTGILSVQLDYGNPFENRKRKPFDFFRVRTEFDFALRRKLLSNITGYGILAGKNISSKNYSILAGAFQYYDYWNNNTFELGTLGLGAGLISRLSFSKSVNLYTNIHAAVVPFAGNSTHFGPDTASLFRDYNFGYGLQGRLETTLSLSDHVTASLVYHYYLIRTYIGYPGDNYIGIFRPRITIQLFKGLSFGVEDFIYNNNRSLSGFPAIHSVRTEQTIFLLLYLEDKQRRGHYQ